MYFIDSSKKKKKKEVCQNDGVSFFSNRLSFPEN